MEDAEYIRRRRWSDEEKRAIVELTRDPECSVAEVARSFELLPAQIYSWRRELREAAEAEARDACEPMFLPVVMEPEMMSAAQVEADRQEARLLPDALVQVALEVQGVPVLIAHGADPALVTSVIATLKAAR